MVRPNYQRAVETGLVQRYRETAEFDGHLFQVETVLVPIRDETGRISRIMGSSRDMSVQAQLEAAEAARRESDAIYRAYFQNSTEGLFSIAVLPDGEFSMEEVNPAYEAAVGLGAQGKLGQPLDEQMGPEAAAQIAPNYRRAVETGQVQRYREAVEIGGHLFQVETVLVPVRDETGRVTRIMGSSRDMTVQAQLEAAEAARREADALYRGYFQNTAEGLFVIGVQPDGGFVLEEINPSHEAVLGIPKDEWHGRRIEEFLSPEAVDAVSRNYRRVLEQDRPQRYRESAEIGGKLRHFETVLVPVRDDQGRITRLIGSSRDMTTQVEAEAARREADALYRAYFQNSAESLFVIGVAPDGGFTMEEVNPTHEALVGMPTSEIRGRRVDEGLPPEVAKQVCANYRQAVELGHPYRYQESVEIQGRTRHFETVLVPVRDSEDRITRLVGSARDMTAQVEAEEKLRQSQKLESMGQLTGGVAHDFNNLLTPIMTALDRLQWKRLGDATDWRMIDGALQSAERARTLVQRLLAFARRQPLETTAVDVGDLVRGMAELVASTTGPQIRLEVQTDPDLSPALADANQVEMAVLNLALNARDAMPEGGNLRLSAVNAIVEPEHPSGARPGAYVRLSVSDTGIGMDEDTLKRAVEPFFSTKGVGKGTGLGLSMAHGLAAQLGGVLTISSELGRGTDVELWLPVAGDAVQGQPRPGSQDRPAVAPAGTALLVDDDDLVRGAAAFTLADLGYAVTEAASAEEAIQILDGGLDPDLLVTDHLMPGMSGTDLVRLLQKRRPGLATLIVSGYAEVAGIAPDLPRLTKPFRGSELAAAIARLTAKGAA